MTTNRQFYPLRNDSIGFAVARFTSFILPVEELGLKRIDAFGN
ncbi:MAG: hypothetical protein U0Y10_03865 [Spirosomataceae bacterium]